jgi:hypothetical protein
MIVIAARKGEWKDIYRSRATDQLWFRILDSQALLEFAPSAASCQAPACSSEDKT